MRKNFSGLIGAGVMAFLLCAATLTYAGLHEMKENPSSFKAPPIEKAAVSSDKDTKQAVPSAGRDKGRSTDRVEAAKAYELRDRIKVRGKSGYCIDCHRAETPGIFNEWCDSAHARANIGCAECHEVVKSDPKAILHAERFYISVIVTPFKCAKCHKDQMRDYFTSGHARALELFREMDRDDPLYPIVSQYSRDDFRQCAACHGSLVKLGKDRYPDTATWPNSGAGRINPDGSHGTCAACHENHRFSVEAARKPETCLRCHDGRNYPEGSIYRSSVHGTLYATMAQGNDMSRPGYFFTAAEMRVPTCAFCHLGGSGHGLLTRHNPAWRLPRDLTGVMAPMAKRSANLRGYMKSVCVQCHTRRMIDGFFANADRELIKYQTNEVLPRYIEFKKKFSTVKDEEERGKLLQEYSSFLAESKRYRMNLYMGSFGHTQR